MYAQMPVTNRERLFGEAHRLLDQGEPLLALFPRRYSMGWLLELPGTVSLEMRFYADEVAFRAELGRVAYQNVRQQNSDDYLRFLVGSCGSGLLGWRAVGVIG